MTKLRILSHPFTWGGLALLLFFSCLAPWVYPGSAAHLIAHFTDVWYAPNATLAQHPLFTLVFKSFGTAFSVSHTILLFNILSAVCSALCVILLCQIIKHTIYTFADEPRTRPFAEVATHGAIPVAGLALILSPLFLRSATHFQWQTFELFLALGAVYLLSLVARKPSIWKMSIAAFLWGLLTLEGTAYLLLTPFFILALALAYYSTQEKLSLKPFVWNLAVPMGIGFCLTFVLLVTQQFTFDVHTSFHSILAGLVHTHIAEARSYLNGPWILVILTGILPGALTLFILRDAGNNRRTPTLFFTTLTTAILAVLAILPQPLAIAYLTSQWGETYPVLLVVFTAFTLSGLVAIFILFTKVKQPPEAANEHRFIRKICHHSGIYGMILLVVTILTVGLITTVNDRLEQRPFANITQEYCDNLLELHQQEELWVLADGTVDVYLALRVAERSLPVTVFSLAQEHHAAALTTLRQNLIASPYFATKPDLRAMLDRALDIGLIPFIQDWIRNDADAVRHFVTLNLPDLWYTGNRLPLPETLWYRGVLNRDTQHTILRKNPASELPIESAQVLSDTLPMALRHFAQYTHRQRGFVANNTAFYLADSGDLEAAYALFDAVYTYDPENVSALFNLFELINGGLHPEKRTWCEQEVTALIKRMRGQRYRLWALARTYGYIRSPQIISMLAGSWAMSGQTGAALSGLDLALAMLDDGQKTILNKAIADICMADPTKRKEAISRYQQMLSTSTDRKKSLIYVRELVRMHILENNLEAAKQQLEQIDPTGVSPDLAYERALWFASAGQSERAQAALHLCLEQTPKHLEAIAMLATLQLQANEIDVLTTKTLPKLRSVAGTDDDYFVQIISAQLAEKQNNLEKARAAYLRALTLKPEVHALRTTVLTLDIRLNDKSAAARHAKQFLYQDRSLPLANYVMGSLALSEGDAKRALSYLQAATAPTITPPLPEAFNDLAEAQRQLGNWTAALAAAEHACTLSPDLAIARETAAAALLELNRYSEAHTFLKEAFAIERRLRPNAKADPRLYITRARLYEKEGHSDLARVDLAEIKQVYDSLDATAKAEFDALATRIHLR